MANEFNITPAEIEDGKTMGGIAYFGWIGFLIAFFTKRDNKYVMYHAQQSLANCILLFIPFIGWAAHVVFLIIGLLKGFKGEIAPLPLIGQIAFKFGILKPSNTTPPAAPGSPDVE